jgi:hypothetical protein
MHTVTSRVGRRPLPLLLLSLSLVAIAACADDTPPPTAPSASPSVQNAKGLTPSVVMVTNALGNGAFGSLQWATTLVANPGDTVRFDPSLAGDTIYMDATLFVPHYVVIEGPRDKGITISGRKAVRVMDIRSGARLRNLNIIDGRHATHGAGIFAIGPLDLEHTAVFGNESQRGAALYVTDAVLTNSTVSSNFGVGHGAVISYDYHGGLVLDNSTVALNGNDGAYGSMIAPHGVRDRVPSVTLRNSIIADNTWLLDYPRIPNCYDAIGFKYAGRNLVDDASCGDDPTEPTMIYAEEPWLRLINDNGGPTETNKLTIGSQAINHGKGCTVTVDQRYVPRDGKCDIGAYEFTTFTTATLTVNATVNVDAAGFASLTGTTKCSNNSVESKPNTMLLRVKLTQEQKGRGAPPTTVYASTNVGTQCGIATTTWSVPLKAFPYDKEWRDGAAVAEIETDAEGTPEWVAPASLSATVKVVRPRK